MLITAPPVGVTLLIAEVLVTALTLTFVSPVGVKEPTLPVDVAAVG